MVVECVSASALRLLALSHATWTIYDAMLEAPAPTVSTLEMKNASMLEPRWRRLKGKCPRE